MEGEGVGGSTTGDRGTDILCIQYLIKINMSDIPAV